MHLSFFILFAVIILPICSVIVKGLSSSFADDSWLHFKDYLLVDLFFNTLWPLLGVGFLSLLLGGICAFLTVFCQYPGRGIFRWLFVLPLAFPLYVTSFVYVGLLEYSGPFLSWFRQMGDIHLEHYFKIKSLFGLCLVFSLCLYPYVYLLMRNAFLSVGKKTMLQARSLGIPPHKAIFKLIIPLCRPWILGGVLLVMMETLSDFGGFSVFNHDTLTTAIYTAWFGFFSVGLASKIAVILIIIAFLLIVCEQKNKPNAVYSNTEPLFFSFHLSFLGKSLCLVFSLVLVFFSFIIPVLQLFFWSKGQWDLSGYGFFFMNSFLFAFLGGVVTVGLGIFWAYLKKIGKFKSLIDFSILGYALPGTLVALSVFVCFKSVGLHFSWGPLLTLLLAYAIRFLAVGHRPINNAYGRMTANLDLAARSLGQNRWKIFKKIHIPFIDKSIFTAFMLIFVELLKEMPITLLIRPFNWDTLAVKIFEFTSEGEWERASVPAILLVSLGVSVVLIMNRRDGGQTRIGA